MLSLERLKEILPDPIVTISRLDEYIIGQEEAKKALALMLLNRAILKLNRAGLLEMSVPLQKSSTLLIGPSGVGKTALMKALGEIADVPITIFDVTSITSGAYIGNKVEDILVNHVNNCYQYVKDNITKIMDYNEDILDCAMSFPAMLQECVETGIIYIDEIDKTRSLKGVEGHGDSVQNELLKILEDSRVSLQPARRVVVHGCDIKEVNTKDIMFVGGGAFYELTDIIKGRISKNVGMGFGATIRKGKEHTDEELFQYVTTRDLVDYGFKHEFLGRLPLRATLKPLTKEALTEIMKYSRNSVLVQYKELFNLFNIQLEIEKEAYMAIAELAIELQTGARSLKTILNNILSEEFCCIFSNTEPKFVITKEIVQQRGLGKDLIK